VHLDDVAPEDLVFQIVRRLVTDLQQAGFSLAETSFSKALGSLRDFFRGKAVVDMPGNPYLVRWTAHALAKVEILGIDRVEIERAILEYDHVRRQNPGAAAWRINAGRLVIVYQHPDQGDRSAARVVTVWRKR